MLDPVKQLMSDIFKIPAGEIPDDATVGRVEQWDSMHHLELMLALETAYSITISVDQMLELMSLESIMDFLQQQAAPRAD